VSDNLSEFILTAVVCSAAVYDFEASYVTGSWLQLSTHTCLQPHCICHDFL